MRHEASFRFRTSDARHIYRAVVPELAEEHHARSRVLLRLEDSDTVFLRICAADIPALRASLNMWLRLISVADEMKELIKPGGISTYE
jgi:KEOPS complex subunit Pcc1